MVESGPLVSQCQLTSSDSPVDHCPHGRGGREKVPALYYRSRDRSDVDLCWWGDTGAASVGVAVVAVGMEVCSRVGEIGTVGAIVVVREAGPIAGVEVVAGRIVAEEVGRRCGCLDYGAVGSAGCFV